MKILMIVSEMDGIVKTGGLADFAAALPGELVERGHDVRVAVPKYRDLALWSKDPVPLSFNLNHHQRYGCLVHPVNLGSVSVRLIEHHDFFSRHGIYGYDNSAYPDNVLRYAFFCKAALEDCLKSDWVPDIVHCNDWQTALIPYYLKEHYLDRPDFEHTRSLLTIHNGDFQGKTDRRWIDAIGIRQERFTHHLMEEYGLLNQLKCGIMYADAINAVSPGYARELLQPDTSHNLWPYLNKRKTNFQGILNGCDYTLWNPRTDSFLPHHFFSKDLIGKYRCKKALQRQMGLPENKKYPLLGLVARLTAQKGFDYLIPALERLLYEEIPVQIVLLGSGEPEYGSRLHYLQLQYPRKMSFVNGYDNRLSHLIEAGSDFFMMPSLFEPCGLNQLYSLAYGTLPIIRETGGLKDTVVGLASESPTGISFVSPDNDSCYNGLKQAISLYTEQHSLYLEIQQRAMEQKFTWKKSADEYEGLYRNMLKKM